ncbi:GGDEF domain-containing protein [Salinivibrio sp. ES.052]|uniref:GGDEF domain-containing protein n=1 Tax=Salinivibrio sp. ES.052 TaxID=1882823 RepID=UPI000929B9E0|nr:GGDEF domain-containing protein [Salinivibrio sp. ES.052]SIO27470.1 diguanylate cyclase (GGDEF) domain-containing protein [Salinivibrio sp. ES.052]
MAASSIQILDSIVDFTAETEVDAITKSLLTSITALTPVDEVVLLDYCADMQPAFTVLGTNANSAFQQENIDQIDALLDECLSTQKITQHHSDDHVLIAIPIYYEKGDDIRSILCGRATTLSHEQRALLSGLTHIYENYQQIIMASERDSFTSLFNRKVLSKKLDLICERLAQSESVDDDDAEHVQSPWIGIFDIDHFKQINDNFGHVFGDEVILLIASLMRQAFSAQDSLFRYGGDEFVVLFQPCTRAMAEQKANTLVANVNARDFGAAQTVTISMGATRIERGQLSTSTILGNADQALYHAKQNGRNQVAFYDDLRQSGMIKTFVAEDDVELF